MKPISQEEVVDWFNANNIIIEKISLFHDVFIYLYEIADATYMGETNLITSIEFNGKDVKNHFEWCWNQMIDSFKTEGIVVNYFGEHRDYIETFFLETFYNQVIDVRQLSKEFITSTFNINKTFTMSDLEVLTDIYLLMERNSSFNFTN
jgi:hypothetical protein